MTEAPKLLAGERERLLELYGTYLRPYWRSCVVLLAGYLLVAVLQGVQPLLMAPILDVVVGGGQAGSLAPSFGAFSLNNAGERLTDLFGLEDWSAWRIVVVIALIYFGVTALRAIASFGNYMLALWIRVRASRDMQQNLYEHMLSLSLDFFHRRRTGELISRLDRDTLGTVSGLEPVISNVVVNSLLVLIYGGLLVATNLRLTLLVVVAAGLHGVLTRAIRNPIRSRVRDQFNVLADVTSYWQEVLLSIRVVKSFAAERYEASRLRAAIATLVRVNMRYGVFKHVHQPSSAAINAAISVGILLLAAWELFQGRLSTPGFFLYLYVGKAIVEPIGTLGMTYTMLQQTLASGERVTELFDERPSIVGGKQRIEAFHDALVFDDVSFRYEQEPVLRNVDLRIRQGEIVALVGPSGAGKSTLTDLILRFYDPERGRITIDGRDLRELDLASYRRLFGVVSQESLLFNASVRDNIAYAAGDVPFEEIEEAARVANAHDFILELPRGYDTVIGDRGVRLSGGQRQRLAIARAIVRHPQILILDEATSSLDSESERLVQQAIDRVIEGTTAIVVAHRLSTVLHADNIVVLERGAIVDQGRHAELLDRCALYRRLCQLQFGVQGMAALVASTSAEPAAEG